MGGWQEVVVVHEKSKPISYIISIVVLLHLFDVFREQRDVWLLVGFFGNSLGGGRRFLA
jgi:hypothetical protein